MNETTQQEKTTQLGNMNETTQQEKTTQLNSRNEQLNSPVGTKQLNSEMPSAAYNRLQPPALPAPPLQQNRLFLHTHMKRDICKKPIFLPLTLNILRLGHEIL
ncbi:hypothetical protein TNCV_1198611 [Trichonephila clavipes]|uniref:Uncharacterized protein n=1 Tax=Trichonephila clavipes TaxID=2585209 RepID=A0A8X6SBP9_TRICX|nr:hypothetical protein TNCV_1198611 [Trichonephila clavipes]